MKREQIIESLTSSKNYLKENHGVKQIALFGSYARNENTPSSDIELLVEFNKPTYRNLCHTLYYLEPIFDRIKLQLVTRKAIKDRYFEFIKDDLIYV